MTDNSNQSSSRTSNNFDALRLAAALAVLYSHQYPVTATTPPQWMNVPMIGGAAVMVFFVISGYLVTISWWNQPLLWAFVAKRVMRIWPALVVVVLLSIFVLGSYFTTTSTYDYWRSPITWNYLRNIALQIHFDLPDIFVSNPIARSINGSLWTIPIEVGCYIILAICGFLGLLRSRQLWALACIAYLVWFISSQTMDITGSMQHRLEFPAYFVFGSLIACYRTHFLQNRLAFCLAATIAAILVWQLGFPYSALLLWMPTLVIAAGTASWYVLKSAGHFGDISYGVYLYAFPIQQSIRALWPELSFTVSLLCVIPVTLAAGWLSWRLVEAPALRLKRHIST